MENGVLLFYFTAPVIELLRIQVFCFLILLPHQNKPDHSEVRHTFCINKDIKSTKCQITVIIEKIILIFQVIIDTFHSTKCIVSCHLDISRSYYPV